MSHTKVRIKPKNLLKSSFSYDFYAFTSRCLWRKSVLCGAFMGVMAVMCFLYFYFLFTTYEVQHSWKDEFRILFDSRMKEYSASDSKKCRYYRNGIMYEFGYSLLT